jgi:hypothetical protein
VAQVAAADPERRWENARLAAFTRWSREHTRVFLALLWLCTLVLPPVVVLALPVEAQSIIAGYVAAVGLMLMIHWRVTDNRKR